MSEPMYRVPISLPCMVPVLPGTPDAHAPIDQRTETCNVDGWFVIGRAPICDIHLTEILGDGIPDGLMDPPPPDVGVDWHDRHRYDQNPAALFDGHPVRVAFEARGAS